MGKHTNGPWTWWTSNSFKRLTGGDGKDGGVLTPSIASDGHPILSVREDDERLIAAAPDMFEALENVLIAHEFRHKEVEAWAEVKAAIAKARGAA
jgi:hypothetical protein